MGVHVQHVRTSAEIGAAFPTHVEAPARALAEVGVLATFATKAIAIHAFARMDSVPGHGCVRDLRRASTSVEDIWNGGERTATLNSWAMSAGCNCRASW